ncbi:hypothetical protein VTN96DRAFT_8427 [Rasamsonia emersonii]
MRVREQKQLQGRGMAARPRRNVATAPGGRACSAPQLLEVALARHSPVQPSCCRTPVSPRLTCLLFF